MELVRLPRPQAAALQVASPPQLTELEQAKLDESQRLAALERIIAPNLRAFVATGRALAEIRDRRLYREKYINFAAYCEERWGLSRSRAHRLIEAAATTQMLPTGNTQSQGLDKINERIARELTILRKSRPDLVASTYNAVVANVPRVTYQEVRKAVNAVLGNATTSANVTEIVKAAVTPVRQAQHTLREDYGQQRNRAQAIVRALSTVASLPQPRDVFRWLTSEERATIGRLGKRAIEWHMAFLRIDEDF